MKKAYLILLVFYSMTTFCQDIEIFKIPKQEIDVFLLLGDTSKNIYSKKGIIKRSNKPKLKLEVNEFYISSQITLKEYKKYLKSIKKRVTKEYYQSQLPDKSIFSNPMYENYLSNDLFEDFPVVGISWNNAMNYCKWKTFKDNTGDTLTFIYRLPYLSEWLSANKFYNNTYKKGLNDDYSDWLLNSKNEGYLSEKAIDFDDFYFQDNKDIPDALLRYWVCGNNWKNDYKYPIDFYRLNDYYAFRGYDYVSFRFVKYDIKKETFEKNKENNIYPIEYWLIKRWSKRNNP